ncbi:MAG: RDD family protein [Bryobacterales bacterium]|nr:RDD family protein [Bryobacterales bacterium]
MVSCPICRTTTGRGAVYCIQCGATLRTPEVSLSYARFLTRAKALLIDYGMLTCISFPLALVLLPPNLFERIALELGPDAVARDERIRTLLFVRACLILTINHVLYFFYSAYADSFPRTGTLGKRRMRLTVVDQEGKQVNLTRSVLRQVARAVSIMVGHLGFLAPLVNRRKRTFHDALVRTYVVARIDR